MKTNHDKVMREYCIYCGEKLTSNNWYLFDKLKHYHIYKTCKAKRNTWWKRNTQKWREISMQSMWKYRKDNLDIFTDFERVRYICRRDSLPNPSLKNEVWYNGRFTLKVRVARENNGRFISWKTRK